MTTLAADPGFAKDTSAIVTALAICTALAGVLQIAFSRGGLSKLPAIHAASGAGGLHQWRLGVHPGLAAQAVPAQLAAGERRRAGRSSGDAGVRAGNGCVPFLVCIAHEKSAGAACQPDCRGRRLSRGARDHGRHRSRADARRVAVSFPPIAHIGNLWSPETRHLLFSAAPDIVLVALATVVVGSFQSLLAFRMAENMLNAPISPDRGLVASASATSFRPRPAALRSRSPRR